MRLGYQLIGRPIGKYLFWRFDVRVLGVENIPTSGPLLFVGNHQREFDGALVLRGIPRRVRTIIKSDQESKLALLLLGIIADTFTIKRNSSDIGAIRRAKTILESNIALCMFPEAHRSREVIGFHPGVASIARGVEHLQIVPFGITNADHLGVSTVIKNLHTGIKTGSRPTIRFGVPFQLPTTHLPKRQQRSANVEMIRRKVLDLLPADMEGENVLHVVEH